MNTAKGAILLSGFCFAGCGADLAEDALPKSDSALVQPKTEMLAPFSAISLRRDPPTPAAAATGLHIVSAVAGEGEAIHYGMIGRFRYIGALANGVVFRSTYSADGGEPELLRLLPPAVPQGFALGIDGCKVGERRTITVPSELGFGAQPHHEAGVTVPAHALLVYDVELVEVVHGLQVGTLHEGTGPELQYGQQAQMHYTGVLAKDGTVIDTTAFGTPATVRIEKGQGIPGWWLGLPGMKVQEKRRLKIPAALAYGKTGKDDKIGPDQDLIYDFELVSVL